MAYMRGKYYLWRDESGLHLWNRDGYDNWDVCSWACDEQEVRHPGMERASGVSVPQDVMDEYVLMRLAQMLEEGAVDAAIERATTGERSGNFGGIALAENAEAIRAALKGVKMKKQEP